MTLPAALPRPRLAAALGLALLAACTPVRHAADVTFVGEVHDNPAHHRMQAGVSAALDPKAIVFEMIPRDAEEDLYALREEGASRAELAEALDWPNSGWPTFDYYAPIIEAAPDAQIYGAEVTRETLRAVLANPGSEGLILGESPASWGLDTPLPPEEQALREEELQHAHCDALPPEALAPMLRAQRLRDAALAAATERALDEAGTPVLVIAGNGHVRLDTGAPAFLRARRPWLTIDAIGQTEREGMPDGFDSTESLSEDTPFTRLFVSRAVERPDPCAAFREG
ncbi:ChaN family lipoprotein [Oceanicella sp. SM1341]|uniref:ChaN family lipoprotein n=1 Tax=Oceanicella sp. SM1341 TaxID=1548889 RepID=UPI000E4F1F7F|nr:ChaN family lipoprotein [Oceanicella sp. SM1341]